MLIYSTESMFGKRTMSSHSTYNDCDIISEITWMKNAETIVFDQYIIVVTELSTSIKSPFLNCKNDGNNRMTVKFTTGVLIGGICRTYNIFIIYHYNLQSSTITSQKYRRECIGFEKWSKCIKCGQCRNENGLSYRPDGPVPKFKIEKQCLTF